ncbi:MAG: DEAD/DEAH box helicase, partial [Bacteroidales bacterium]|nr:DEAD/DEAH box helicase [Bacteroidales bacterium]
MEQPLKNTKFAARNYGTTANSAELHAANAANAADPANTADKVANAADATKATNSAELLATKATKATNAIDTADRPYKRFKMANSFQELGLNSYLIKAISEMGFEKPTPVQERIIPTLLA